MNLQTCIPAISGPLIQDKEDEPPSYFALTNPIEVEDKTFTEPSRFSNLLFVEQSKTQHVNLVSKRQFRKFFFPQITSKEWNDWHWQIQHRIRTYTQLSQILQLSYEEQIAIKRLGTRLPLSITPYYMGLLSRDNPMQPIRRTVVPTLSEFLKMPGEAEDPLGEETQSPVHGLVHRYPDRVLLLVLDFCSTYCRYCTRSRVVGHNAIYPSKSRLEKAIEYIEKTPTIRDVLLSGGDPLTLSDDRLEWIIKKLRSIRHVEIIRLGTKIPAVLPQRVTRSLVKMLRKYHPIFMSLHFTHPDECTEESYRACAMLADAGIPLGSQTVLLKDINDDVNTMKSLMHHLLKMRVRPYYLYQCDPILGSGHFRTPVEKGLEIIHGLRGFTTGYAVPTYVIDAPEGGGKIPLMTDYVVGHDGESYILKNFEGNIYRYPDQYVSRSKMIFRDQ
ncbi:MAG: KamA family radical SAM protein [Desulfobacterales bacterium]|nr:KamA family radical SAM protein [Desulfobacterales bacterium]